MHNEEPTMRIDIREYKNPPPVDASDLWEPESTRIDPKTMGMKFCKAHNDKPLGNKFIFTPSIMPELKHAVEQVRWNFIESKLMVIIGETPTMSAYRWFSTINERHDYVAGHVDYDTDIIYLSLLDKSDKEVARFKFKGIQLIDHECLFKQGDLSEVFGVDGDEDVFLAHALEFKYNKVEQVDLRELIETTDEEKDLAIDDEWQTYYT